MEAPWKHLGKETRQKLNVDIMKNYLHFISSDELDKVDTLTDFTDLNNIFF